MQGSRLLEALLYMRNTPGRVVLRRSASLWSPGDGVRDCFVGCASSLMTDFWGFAYRFRLKVLMHSHLRRLLCLTLRTHFTDNRFQLFAGNRFLLQEGVRGCAKKLFL